MNSTELAKQLLRYPEFEVRFSFTDGYNIFPNIRSFKDIIIEDVGHGEKIILLGGDEREF